MRKETEEKYLSVFRKDESLTQKEVAARLNVSLSGVTTALRTLYEKGLLTVEHRPGFSMRYSRFGDSDVLRTPNGSPLYSLFDKEISSKYISEIFKELAIQLTTETFRANEEDRLRAWQSEIKSGTISTLRNFITLCEILANASPEQFKATLEAYEKKEGTNRNDK